jgi:hypothetical protein
VLGAASGTGEERVVAIEGALCEAAGDEMQARQSQQQPQSASLGWQ